MAAVHPRALGIFARFRRPFVSLLAVSLAVGCSHTERTEHAEQVEAREVREGKPEAAPVTADDSQQLSAVPDGATAAPPPVAVEGRVDAPPAAAAIQPFAPPAPVKSVGDAKHKASAASPSLAGGLGVTGSGAGGAGRGVGMLSGRVAAVAPMPMRAAMRSPAVLAPKPGVALAPGDTDMNTEAYAHVTENPFLAVANQPLSTFSIDVDTASYSNSRRFLADGSLPPKDAIRVEEWLNYFSYNYPQPSGNEPFSVNTEVTGCPWNAQHKLVRIGIKGREISEKNVPARNLVFLLDVSGSMMSADKLPLVKRGLAMLADSLRPQDSIAIVVYAGNSGLVLPATSGSERGKILKALDGLEAGGSTNGGAGIQLAYSVAQQQFKKGGINRVILATDGDFNVGTTSEGELTRLIEQKRQSGVFLTVLGFGTGNVKDSTMEMLADKGNGNYAYIDTLGEARKVLVREAGSTLVTIAKDVKLQVEMNPLRIKSYKLIGYENRLLAKEDFNDDKKDAGEIGAGHSVTALYEVVPVGAAEAAPASTGALKYQTTGAPSAAAASAELMTVSVRYKPPQGDVSTKFSVIVKDDSRPIEQMSDDYRFSVAVADAALVLRGSPDVKQSSLAQARKLAAGALGPDLHGDRREFIAMLDAAQKLMPAQGVLKTVAR